MEGPGGSFDEGDLPGHQGRLAFAALAVERRPISHGDLADIIWDGEPPSQWRSALAAVLSKTRTLVSTTGLDGQAVLASTGGTYAFTPPADMWIDLERAYRCLDRAEGAMRHDSAVDAATEATVASGILRRPFLAGENCLWLDQIRIQQTDALYRTFITLASAWNQLGDHQLAAVTASSAVKLDPYRELGHRLLIEAEHARGDSGAALQAYQRCERALDEIGAQPSYDTKRLAAQLHSDDSGA